MKRWPSKELVPDRSQGVQLETIQALTRYWATEYDWRRCEAKLNALPQFKTEIDGEDIHFLHVRSRHENALPLIITHGWPGSVIELLEIVGPLADPTAHGARAEDAFDLVLPSSPATASRPSRRESVVAGRVAQARGELMPRLRYARYVAQGGDQGAAVTDAMARLAPEGLIGIHTNFCAGRWRAAPARGHRGGAGGRRGGGDLQDERLRLLPRADHAAPYDRGRPAGFAGRAGGMDARPRHRQLLQDLACLSRLTDSQWAV